MAPTWPIPLTPPPSRTRSAFMTDGVGVPIPFPPGLRSGLPNASAAKPSQPTASSRGCPEIDSRAGPGTPRQPAEIDFSQQAGVDADGDLPQRLHLLGREHVEYEPANLAEVDGPRRHQLPVALVAQLGMRCATSGPAPPAHPGPPLQARDHVREARQGAIASTARSLS